ncbi:hypothetical protein PVAND_014396 [Polypedilum vanderplanki]|uniref:Chitin-binding type-2 domain-containing protein n=1 Tax=Polypedilum vanderplanki TaxID=319348 RepID=A0A9J6B9J4_POLVA|nr:hypothetical protein PVAND_014396 [Polypedilum vanderplanki]
MKKFLILILIITMYGSDQKSLDKNKRSNDITACLAPAPLVCIGALDANQKYPHSDLSLYYMCNRDGSSRIYACPCDQLFDYNRQECAYPPVHIACRDDAITNKYPYPCYTSTTPPWDITTTTWFTTFPWTTTWVTTTTTTTTTIPPPL